MLIIIVHIMIVISRLRSSEQLKTVKEALQHLYPTTLYAPLTPGYPFFHISAGLYPFPFLHEVNHLKHLNYFNSSTGSAILISGAAGAVGASVANQLALRGHLVIGIDLMTEQYSSRLKYARMDHFLFRRKNVMTIIGDACDSNLLQWVFSHFDIKVFIHLAHASADGAMNSFNCQDHCISNILKVWHNVSTNASMTFMPKLVIPESKFRACHLLHLSRACDAEDALINRSFIALIPLKMSAIYGPWINSDSYLFQTTNSLYSTHKQRPYSKMMTRVVQAQDRNKSRSFIYIDQAVEIITDLALSSSTGTRLQYSAVQLSEYKLLTYLKEIARTKSAGQQRERRLENDQSLTSLAVNTTEREGFAAWIEWYKSYHKVKIPCDAVCGQHSDLCFQSGWSKAAHKSRHLTNGCRTVVYTVLVGLKVDSIQPIDHFWGGEQACSIAYMSAKSRFANISTDEHRFYRPDYYFRLLNLKTHHWQIVYVEGLEGFGYDRRASRLPKFMPDHFFAHSVTHAIYIDSKLQLMMHPNELLSLFYDNNDWQHMNHSRNTTVMLLVRHPVSSDLFADVHSILKLMMSTRPTMTSDPDLLRLQALHYHRQGATNSLCYRNMFDSALIVHRLQSTVARTLRCDWYTELQEWSDRDQIAGSYILARRIKEHLSVNYSETSCGENDEYLPVATRRGQTYYVRMLAANRYSWSKSRLLARRRRFEWHK